MIAATVTGNVGRMAEVKAVGDGTVLSFTLASRRYEKGEEKTDWLDISMWGQRGQKLQQYVTKGSRVAVRGIVWMREYEHNGEKRYALTMRADDIELLGGGERRDETPAPARAAQSRQDYPDANDLPF